MLGIDESNRPWWTLGGTCSGLFLLMLDSTVVALALPSIRHDVGATSTGLQWVMNGYLLAIAVFVVTAGRLGDMFGRKRSATPTAPAPRPGRRRHLPTQGPPAPPSPPPLPPLEVRTAPNCIKFSAW